MSVYSATVLATAGLVSYWRLGEQSGTTAADSFGANTGTYTSTINYGASSLIKGDPNGAMNINNAGRVDSGNAAGLQLTTVSIEGWVYLPTQPNSYAHLFGKASAYAVYARGGSLQTYDFGANTDRLATVSAIITDNTPHHIVMTSVSGGAGQTLLYLDGLLVMTNITTVANQSLTFTIGGRTDVSTQNTVGTIDEVAVYNVVLSAATVTDHYRQGRSQMSNNYQQVRVGDGISVSEKIR